MEILVTGKSGQLGKALSRNEATASWRFLDRNGLDLNAPGLLEQALGSEQFDVLINTAAYTAVDRAEDEEEAAHTVNAKAVEAMAEACQKRGAALIHISTDYVFAGERALPAREDDQAAPIGVYGRSKWAGEEAIRAYCPKHLIVRTSWLYGAEGHNFLKTMLRLAEQRESLKVVYDQVGTPTLVDDLAAVIVSMVQALEKGDKPYGTYHFANEGVASWYDFAQAIFALSGKSIQLSPVRSAAFPTKARRPAYSVLDKQKIKDTFGFEIRHWREALAACLEEMKKA